MSSSFSVAPQTLQNPYWGSVHGPYRFDFCPQEDLSSLQISIIYTDADYFILFKLKFRFESWHFSQIASLSALIMRSDKPSLLAHAWGHSDALVSNVPALPWRLDSPRGLLGPCQGRYMDSPRGPLIGRRTGIISWSLASSMARQTTSSSHDPPPSRNRPWRSRFVLERFRPTSDDDLATGSRNMATTKATVQKIADKHVITACSSRKFACLLDYWQNE